MRIFFAALLLFFHPDTALAASNGSEAIMEWGTGLGGNFDEQLEIIGTTFVQLSRLIVLVMTVVAALMVGLGIESGKRTLWNWILGAGLAVNFGSFIIDTGIWDYADSTGGAAAHHYYEPELADKAEDSNILSGFMENYLDGVVKPGAEAILPYCMKLLLILTIIEASWEMSFKLISGDKIKYLLTVTIKCGFFLWLMDNWIPLMDALSNGFQQLGLLAGGAGKDLDLKPDSIWHNAVTIVSTFWKDSSFSNIPLFLINLFGMVAIIVATFLTAVEMFMARIEFFTMALITIPLLPFAMTSKFSFLSDKAIGAMFNLAIKVSVISFISAMAVPFMKSIAEKSAETEDIWLQPGIMLQAVLAAIIVYYLVKKIPDLVSGLLSGQPSLGGSGMIDTASSVASTAGGAVGAVRAAHALAQSKSTDSSKMGALKAGTVGTLAELGKAALYSRSPVQGYRRGINRMRELNQSAYQGNSLLEDIRKGDNKEPDKNQAATPQATPEQKAKERQEIATKSADKYVDETPLPK